MYANILHSKYGIGTKTFKYFNIYDFEILEQWKVKKYIYLSFWRFFCEYYDMIMVCIFDANKHISQTEL